MYIQCIYILDIRNSFCIVVKHLAAPTKYIYIYIYCNQHFVDSSKRIHHHNRLDLL